ncbi:unnamed protein product, partial [Tilletia controversa]
MTGSTAPVRLSKKRGGFYYAAVAHLVFVHHSTFCVNSLAHWLGEASFDNKMTPRDHFITALVTVGECYHNFHHQFPMDYRNATKWYQSDPTKWSIATMSFLGLASHLHVFPDNEVRKGRLSPGPLPPTTFPSSHGPTTRLRPRPVPSLSSPASSTMLAASWSSTCPQHARRRSSSATDSPVLEKEAFNADAALVLLAIFTETEDDPETIARNVAIEKEIDHFLGISKDAQSSSSQQAIGFTPQRREAAALSSMRSRRRISLIRPGGGRTLRTLRA